MPCHGCPFLGLLIPLPQKCFAVGAHIKALIIPSQDFDIAVVVARFAVWAIFVDWEEFVGVCVAIETEHEMAGFVQAVVDKKLKIPTVDGALGEDIGYESFWADCLDVCGFVGLDCCAELGHAGLEGFFLGGQRGLFLA